MLNSLTIWSSWYMCSSKLSIWRRTTTNFYQNEMAQAKLDSRAWRHSCIQDGK